MYIFCRDIDGGSDGNRFGIRRFRISFLSTSSVVPLKQYTGLAFVKRGLTRDDCGRGGNFEKREREAGVYGGNGERERASQRDIIFSRGETFGGPVRPLFSLLGGGMSLIPSVSKTTSI